MKDPGFDVTAIGSTMVRMSVPAGERLETAPRYEVRAAGSASNTLVACARMGLRTAWFSRLRADALGRRVAMEIHSLGVDTSRVVWADDGRNETFFVEYSLQPRPTEVLYDRECSAVSRLRTEELDLDALFDTKILHCTGIFPALSGGCRDVLAEAIEGARARGVGVSMDVNYRAKLWSSAEAREVLTPLIAGTDYLTLSSADADTVFGIRGEAEELAHRCSSELGPPTVVVTLGGQGTACVSEGEYYYREGFHPGIVDRLGAGDALTAGVLCGILEGSVRRGIDLGQAMAAIKCGIHGDHFVSDRAEVEELLRRGSGARDVGR